MSGTPAQPLEAVSAATDRHWDDAFPEKPRHMPQSVQDAFLHCRYQSHYVHMRDGVRIATDVLLPPVGMFKEVAGLPCVLMQQRYQRGFNLRANLAKLTNGRPPDVLSQKAKTYMLAAGYAVVTVDVRGSGASFGRWRAAWADEERKDAAEVVDWIVSQPWSNQQVCLWGTSYNATSSLLALAEHHPSVKAAAAMYPMWDLYCDIGLPGGIPLHLTANAWGQSCSAWDSGKLWRLPYPTNAAMLLASRGCQPVVAGYQLGAEVDVGLDATGSADGKAISEDSTTSSSSGSDAGHNIPAGGGGLAILSKSGGRRLQSSALIAVKSEGKRNLRAAIAQHKNWRVAEDLATVRCVDEVAPSAKTSLSTFNPCRMAAAVAASHVPLYIISGRQLVIGPWVHNGSRCYDLAAGTEAPSLFFHPLQYIRFLDRTLCYSPAGRPSEVFSGLTPEQPAGEGAADEDSRGSASSHSVNYFMMGYRPHWRATSDWPPHDMAAEPLTLHLAAPDALNCGTGMPSKPARRSRQLRRVTPSCASLSDSGSDEKAGLEPSSLEMPPGSWGGLSDVAPGQQLRWRHNVSRRKYIKGYSRFDIVNNPKKPLQYSGLQEAGHVFFTGPLQQQPLHVAGAVIVDMWLSSSDADADIFAYLEEYDPATDEARYITEGCFRASHRAEPEILPADDDRVAACLPGAPFHSFKLRDVQPLQPHTPVRCRFQLMPTAYCFAPGRCLRLAFGGADSKHFTVDHKGRRTIWLHSGAETPSRVHIPILDL